MNILSLFDGISVGRVALERAGIKVNKYYRSEIDKYAITVSNKNYLDNIHLGNVEDINEDLLRGLPKINLLIGGSPCQDISLAKRENRKGLDGDKSKLFFEYLRILEWLRENNNPNIKFLLENVKGGKKDIDAISEYLQVEPILINSDLVSAQTRKRNYWTNIEGVNQPKDLGVQLTSILEHGYTEKEKAYCLTATYGNVCPQNYFIKSERQMIFTYPVEVKVIPKGRLYIVNGEEIPIYPSLGADANRENLNRLKKYTRKLTPIECERLQTLPDDYTDGIPTYERYKCLGNGWTVDVIAHIFSFLKNKYI
jgi:site-specific DNA-cytosine methylase